MYAQSLPARELLNGDPVAATLFFWGPQLNSDDFAQKRDTGARSFVWPIYVALVAITWLVNYPGRLNPDLLGMLIQAQNIGELNDWHAPSVTWLLGSLFTPLLSQPAGRCWWNYY